MHWYFVFFLVSGFCSLVYEVVWLRLAMAQFGVLTPLVSIVLSVFLAGLGLGSWVGGRLMSRLAPRTAARPLRFYALVELLIGLSGLTVPALLALGHAWLAGAGHAADWGSPRYFLAAAAWIGVTLRQGLCFCRGWANTAAWWC